MSEETIIAVDLGASSGRVVVGSLQSGKISLQDVHRFENGGVRAADHFQWDYLALWQNIKDGLRLTRQQFGAQIRSIGVDTWGVDFALLGKHDQLLGNPFHYRDEHTNGIVEEAFQTVSREEIFAETGLQFIQINTLYQLLALQKADSPLLTSAHSLLMIPDLFHWLLTGEKANEQTDASTTQFYNPRTQDWSSTLLQRFKLPTDILQAITPPGTNLGKLRKDVAAETGLENTQVILPGTHDTASAVLAVPAASNDTDWCYISSGTWSLMGIETRQPIINDRCRALNFTNEAGVGGTTRVLKNIAGLWLVQECRRCWNAEGNAYTFDELVSAAEQATPLISVIDPDHPSLAAPADMPAAIRDLCKSSGQPIPETPGAVIRCALESLAMRYRQALVWLEELAGHKIETIHIVGGGTQNRLLSQMTADACNRTVIAGPVEATAIGNVMMQAITLGIVNSISEARAMIRASFPLETYQPINADRWQRD